MTVRGSASQASTRYFCNAILLIASMAENGSPPEKQTPPPPPPPPPTRPGVLHAAGKLIRVKVHRPIDPDDPKPLGRPLVHGMLVHAAHFEPKGDVAQRSQPREQGRLLKHDAGVGPRLLDAPAVKTDLPFERLHE